MKQLGRCSEGDLYVFLPRTAGAGGARTLHACREFVQKPSAQIRAGGWRYVMCPFTSITPSPEGAPAGT